MKNRCKGSQKTRTHDKVRPKYSSTPCPLKHHHSPPRMKTRGRKGGDDYDQWQKPLSDCETESESSDDSLDGEKASMSGSLTSDKGGSSDYVPEKSENEAGEAAEVDSSDDEASLVWPKKRSNPETWKINIQKKRRMSGKTYLGMKNKQMALKEARQMGMPCQSSVCRKSSKLNCGEVDEANREAIFKYFWGKLDWKRRKTFVKSLVELSSVKRRRTEAEESRRSASVFYYLTVDGKRLRVCQRMFLSTLGIGAWVCLKWLGRRGQTSKQTEKGKRKTATEEFLRAFLLNLPKVPARYWKSSSSKIYLEPTIKSIIHLYSQYKRSCVEHGIQPLSRHVLTTIFHELNLSLFHPTKEQCYTCWGFKAGAIEASAWEAHCLKKDCARAMMHRDRREAGEKTLLVCMDVQGLLLCPKLHGSSPFYKTSLGVHNFTIVNMVLDDATNYLWHEGEAGVSGNEFASCVIHYLEAHPSYEEYILWSDGCGYQKRNLFMSNALLKFATENNKPVTQKFLERGHTRTECDVVHKEIEKRLRHADVRVPAEYAEVVRSARSDPRPYQVEYVDHTFFKDFSRVNLCKSIRPEKKTGDLTVHDLRVIRYNVDGTMDYKISHSGDWEPYPSPSLKRKKSVAMVTPLYTSSQKIKQEKFEHLQELKKVLPEDFHAFYDGLQHE